MLSFYEAAVKKHNDEVLNNSYPNAGFDIYVPFVQYTSENNTYFIDHKIKATMTERIHIFWEGNSYENIGSEWKTVGRGYCIYPRSSLSRSPLMMANHVGIIDSGYSGNLIGSFRHISPDPNSFVIEKGTRLLQICHPGLLPFTVEIVKKEEDLFDSSDKTQRGAGGFGSTGN